MGVICTLAASSIAHASVEHSGELGKSTIQEWEKHLKEMGNPEKKELHRGFRKIDLERLKAYVSEYPDAYQSKMGELFGCSESGIRNALLRHKTTRKKTILCQEQDPQKAAAHQ